jgi:phospholipid/cholesterol/gamma-HCH transport system substrate-binding protein
MSLRRQLAENARWILAIALLVVLAGISVGYILSQQNLSFPWQDRYRIKAEFSRAAGLERGLGQPVNVAGVRVGTILDTVLEDGRAVAEMEIDPAKLPAVFRDARATLVPTTALKDLRIDIAPGTRETGRLPDGGRIPVARTSDPIDADDLLSVLDADTRDFFRVLVVEGARGTEGRGNDLRRLLKATRPTAEQLRGVSRTLAERHREVRRLVSNLARISAAIGRRDTELADLVGGAEATVGALAAEQAAIEEALVELPGTLAAVRGTLERTGPFARTAAGALDALQPAVDRLPATLDAAAPLAREAAPILRTQVRPFLRDGQPLLRELQAVVPALQEATPYLSSVVRMLTHLSNLVAHNPEGDDEGFLFWGAWAIHNTNSILSTSDANGPAVRGLAVLDCDSVLAQPGPIGTLTGLLGGTLPACPQGGTP